MKTTILILLSAVSIAHADLIADVTFTGDFTLNHLYTLITQARNLSASSAKRPLPALRVFRTLPPRWPKRSWTTLMDRKHAAALYAWRVHDVN